MIESFIIVLACLGLEFMGTKIGKKYRGYVPIHRTLSFWSWMASDWNYIGARKFPHDLMPVRHIGIRRFGFEWERQIEIPMGELRF